ncbi:DNA double-strand break repair nuclease NurA [Stygiolobus caldivivus]|uniref:NurA domain-containing protein n=1 Tax=Stygiolobus caldivivus TaxID=2824673 RepID=A0A8D5U4U1_9CREN|nr:DNA double-strand break repair nuclease NurA [Stygiolobus caldivivus]BCU69490.1 hypothetical protein KN1_07870 [Stygiolobus caldivivus]
MSNTNELIVILDEVIQKYIREYFSIYNIDPSLSESPATLVSNDLINEVTPSKVSREVLAVDGSSRSITSAGGIISIVTLGVSSLSKPLYGAYPGLFGIRNLDLDKPFVALASSSFSKGINAYLYSSKYVTTVSLDGTPFQSISEPERVETELRAILETEALKKLKGQGVIIVDGPLFPSYTFLPEKVKKALTNERLKVLDSNYIGIVKRLDKSDLLVKSLASRAKEISVKYKVDPRGFISDEAFLFQLVRFNFNPPYPVLTVGPLIKEIAQGVKIYVNYLVYPVHRYVPKFSFLRIESFNRDGVNLVASQKFTIDGIPTVLALADKTAKELSSGILRYIAFSLERIGLQESFRGKFEVLNVV